MTYLPSRSSAATTLADADTVAITQGGVLGWASLASVKTFILGMPTSGATGTGSTTGSAGSAVPAGATFFDDFTGTSVDWTKWNPEYGYSSASQGSVDGSAFRVDPRSPPFPGVNPFSLSNSILTISTNPTPSQYLASVSNLPYTSGLLNTQGTFAQKFGYFEIVAKISGGAGMTCQFWLLPDTGAGWPEIDIFEVIGKQPGSLDYNSVGGTSANRVANSQNAYTSDLSTAFHTFGCNWQPDFITFYLDGVQMQQQATRAELNVPMFMIVSMSVGTSTSFQGLPVAGETFPQTYQVDRVTVWPTKPGA